MCTLAVNVDLTNMSSELFSEILESNFRKQAVLNSEEGMSYNDGIEYAYKDLMDQITKIKKELICQYRHA